MYGRQDFVFSTGSSDFFGCENVEGNEDIGFRAMLISFQHFNILPRLGCFLILIHIF